jgi:hypothetical protein
MPRKRRARVTTVTALLPFSIDLAKLRAGNTLEFQVRSRDKLLGTLLIGRGSVEWWPRGNKLNSLRRSWGAFADMLDQHMR